MNNAPSPTKKGPARAELNVDEKIQIGRQEAAAVLSISQRALDYLVANKQLQVRRIGSRVLIPRSELLRLARVDHPEPIAS
jgi:excisionase family DNA binding protein